MQVLKFGGSSVANSYNIQKVIDIVKESSQCDTSIVVLSAIGGCTDALIEASIKASIKNEQYKDVVENLKERHLEIARDLLRGEYLIKANEIINSLFLNISNLLESVYVLEELTKSIEDTICSYGEILSTKIVSVKLLSMGINNIWIDSTEVIKVKWDSLGYVVDSKVTYQRIVSYVESNKSRLYIAPGFIAGNGTKKVVTLGRGGSDYTASLFAAALSARVLEIWTDVNGMMTADPRIVPLSKTISHISYKEALELSHFGAKVVYAPTIEPVINIGVPIHVKNTFDKDGDFTVIESNPPDSGGKLRGISGSKNIALVSLEGSGMIGVPGYSARLFTALAQSKINIILITQASSVHTMCVAVDERDAQIAGEAIDNMFAYELSLGKIDPVIVERGYSIISLVGDDMKNHSGTSGRMFEALGSQGINIRAIAQGSSEKNISVIVERESFECSIRAIHSEFFGERKEVINIFLTGYGNVGKELIALIKERYQISLAGGVDIRVVGVCNSRSQIVNKDGLSLMDIDIALKSNVGVNNIDEYVNKVCDLSLTNSVFVDCTSDSYIATLYTKIISNGINLVTCNKIAHSCSYEFWDVLNSSSKKANVKVGYETTVGAALPIIESIKRLNESGDSVISVEAILSGTINYLFSNYDGTVPFYLLVKRAKELGYTEPDPRTDLCGKDVLRKITIVARECGLKVEQEQVELESAVDASLMEGSLEEFYTALEREEEMFKNRFESAKKRGCKLRYVASIVDGRCKVELKEVSISDPLYGVEGTNNAISIISKYYPGGFVISGAGAGARVTASGVLNDIFKIL